MKVVTGYTVTVKKLDEERRKIKKEMKREKHVSYSSHDSYKSLSEKLRLGNKDRATT